MVAFVFWFFAERSIQSVCFFNFFDLLLNFQNFLLNRKKQNIWLFGFFLMFFPIKKN